LLTALSPSSYTPPLFRGREGKGGEKRGGGVKKEVEER